MATDLIYDLISGAWNVERAPIIFSATTALTPATLNFDVLFIIDETEEEGFIHDVVSSFY